MRDFVNPSRGDQENRLNVDFELAQKKVKSFTKRPNDDELLHIYSLYKQATVGDINIDRPSMFSFEARKKWDAWNEKKGIKQEVAKQSYIDYVNSIAKTYQ